MRIFGLFLLPCLSLMGAGCTSIPTGTISDRMWTPPEEKGEGYVNIRKDWRVEGRVLNVQRDQSKSQVLILAVQDGGRLTSLRLPRRTQVATTATADQIYYDAFQERFDLVGNPEIHQGSLVTARQGADAHLYIHGDGTVREHSLEELPKVRAVVPSRAATTSPE